MQIFPLNFPSEYRIGKHLIRYLDFFEIGQGGPEIAQIAVDGTIIGRESYFGGPPFFFQERMFVPRFKRGFRSSFTLCIVDLDTGKIKDVGADEPIILISHVNEEFVFFYDEIKNVNLRRVRWS